jgi:hypothetical protein
LLNSLLAKESQQKREVSSFTVMFKELENE